MDLYVLLAIAAGVWVLVTLVGSISGISARKQVLALELVVRNLRIKIDDLERSLSRPPGADREAADEVEQPRPRTEEVHEGTDSNAAAQTPPIAASVSAPSTRDTLEQNITSKWFIWLGGVALALSGIFVVKYSIEYGLLGPVTRVVLGVLMAIAFGAAGEWIRRRRPQGVRTVSGHVLIPAALSAAAVATAFGSVYAGYALYGLFSPTVAFVFLVLIAAIAVLLSMLHGPFVAALGLVGAYLVPVLVSTGSHSAWRLFLFLTVINAGGLAVVRHFAWRWLQNAVLAVAILWALLWIVLHPGGADVITLSLYLLVLLLLIFLPSLWSSPRKANDAVPSPALSGVMAFDFIYAMTAAICVTLSFVLLVVRADHDLVSVGGYCLLAITLLAIAYRQKDFELLAALGAVASILILTAWKWQNISLSISALPGGPKVVSVDPVSIRSLWISALLFGGLFGLAGYAGLWRARRPGIWAGVSAGTPILLFAVLYWRAFDLQIDLRWASMGILLSGLALLCAWSVSRHRNTAGFDEALGAYAVAVVAAIALACTMALRDAWLSVALAVTVPATAWIYSKLGVFALRYTAALIGVVVLVRLALNLYIFDYGLEGWLGFNWILYGYGIPALAFYIAARLFRRSEDGRLVLFLESASLLFFVLLLSFEIRHLVGGGRLDLGRYDFTEQALQSVAWGVTALGLLRQYGKGKRMVPLWGYRILGSMTVAQIVLLQCLVFNPIWHMTDVGAWPVSNILAIAYLIPAVICILANGEARSQGEKFIEQVAGTLGLVLIFIYVSLEFRHIFRGRFLNAGTMSDLELYGYSICWLALAGILLFLAVLKKIPAIRYGSLAVTLLVIGKVFLVDMSNLTGLYRAGSFLALGIVLLGIGYLYQRFVFAAPAVADST